MITQVAAEGAHKYLGKIIDKNNFNDLKKDSIKYGFHIGFEGGPADTLVLDCPLFSKKLEILDFSVKKENEFSGHVIVNKFNVTKKLENIDTA